MDVIAGSAKIARPAMRNRQAEFVTIDRRRCFDRGVTGGRVTRIRHECDSASDSRDDSSACENPDKSATSGIFHREGPCSRSACAGSRVMLRRSRDARAERRYRRPMGLFAKYCMERRKIGSTEAPAQ